MGRQVPPQFLETLNRDDIFLKKNLNASRPSVNVNVYVIASHTGGKGVKTLRWDHRLNTPVLSTCLLHTHSGCGKERRILNGPW